MEDQNKSLMKQIKQQTQNNINTLQQHNKIKNNNFDFYIDKLQHQHNKIIESQPQKNYTTYQQQQYDQEEEQIQQDTFSQMIKDIQRKKKIKKQTKFFSKVKLDNDNFDHQLQPNYLRDYYNIKIEQGKNKNLPIIQNLNQSTCYKKVIQEFQKTFNFSQLTPVQMQVIPLALEWSDIICVAPTGSGKTLSYLIPIMNFLITLPPLKQTKSHLGPYTLILVPSRELALQIQEVFQKFAQNLQIKCQCIVGGHSIYKQTSQLLSGSELIVATVGRFKDLIQQNKISLQQCYQLVIDEVDKMMDFQDDLLYIFQHLQQNKRKNGSEFEVRHQEEQCVKGNDLFIQLMTFSATLPEEQLQIINQYTKYAYQIRIEKNEYNNNKVKYEFEYFGLKDTFSEKVRLLSKYLQNEPKKIVVFFNTKLNVERSEKFFNSKENKKINFVVFHGDLQQQKREENLNKFRNDIDILFTTDLGGRGLDITNLYTVINFDLPFDIEKFTHRSGRTGRGNNSGKVISFVGNNDSKLYKDLIQYLKQKQQNIPQFMKVIKIFNQHEFD